MKRPDAAKPPNILSRKEIRKIERDLGIYLDKPLTPMRSGNAQYGVYDENEQYVEDIIADSTYFTAEELIAKIMKLFG
jgi:hypothetical protein